MNGGEGCVADADRVVDGVGKVDRKGGVDSGSTCARGVELRVLAGVV